MASYNTALGRDGPGLLLKAIIKEDPQVMAVIRVIRETHPDILVLQDFDNDDVALALDAFRTLLAGPEDIYAYPYTFAPIGNEGVPSGHDLDGDGYENDWSDALGFGKFRGNAGMVLLSKYPIATDDIRTFAQLLLKEVSDQPLPVYEDGTPLLDPAAADRLPMSYRAHWDVPVLVNGEAVHILASHASPPVFDGPEDLNGLRNAVEILFWDKYLNGHTYQDDQGNDAPFDAARPFIVVGDLNADPAAGAARRYAIQQLLTHPNIQDVAPVWSGAVALQAAPTHTVDWAESAGMMRVDYVLPAKHLPVVGSGVYWPAEDDPKFDDVADASKHRLVWVDIAWP